MVDCNRFCMNFTNKYCQKRIDWNIILNYLSMRIDRFLFPFIFLLSITLSGYSINPCGVQQGQLFFKKIDISDGLSQASVNCFLEDEFGFMWIGTDDGLNRYDGVNFKIIRNGPASEGGLSNSTVVNLLEEPKGILWICTTDGLNRLSLLTGEVAHFADTTINNHFTGAIYDPVNQRIWLATNEGGLKYFDTKDEKIKIVNQQALRKAIVWDFCALDDDVILLNTIRSGIFSLNTKKLTITPFLNDTTSRFRLPGNMVRKVIHHGNELIIGIEDHGVALYNLQTHEHRILSQQNSDLSSNQVYSLGVDAVGNLLVGTDQGGLNIINLKNLSTTVYKKDEFDSRSISSNVIRTIYADSKSNIWIGTYYEGINFINKQSRGICYFGKHPMNRNSLSHNHITAFESASDGGMWIGTDGGGLNHLKDGRFSVITKGPTDRNLDDYVVMCLKGSSGGDLYIGTFRGGLNVLKNGKIKKYTANPDVPGSISNNAVWAIQRDDNGNYWIGTNNGLNKFDPQTEKFTLYRPLEAETYLNTRNNIRSLFIDGNGDLWLGTFGGLGKFNIENEKFEYFISSKDGESGLSNDLIVKIQEDKDHNLWLGTFGGGLNKYNPVSGEIKVFNENNGLPSNIIQSMEIDSKGYIWVSTMKGLARFDPVNETTEILNESFGLQGSVFKHNSSYKTEDGYLYFGGTKGFNIFHPDSIIFPTTTGNIIFTDFQVYDKSIKNGILNLKPDEDEAIRISSYEGHYFTVFFSIPDFVIADKINFKYQLAGFDDRWQYIGNERKITFIGLSPGNYELRIKASSDNTWPDTYARLPISIIPPFYRRPAFLWFSGFMALLIIGSYYQYRTHSYKKRQRELEMLVEEKNREIKIQNDELIKQNMDLVSTQTLLKETNESLEDEVKKRTKKLKVTVDKLNKTVRELDRFVYSASHDLSAPLKSIKGLVNIAKLENKDDNLQLHLKYIEESINKLENVIKDLIQFSRNSRLSLQLTDIVLFDLVKDVLNSFKYLPEFKNLSIEINIPKKAVVKSDRQRLQMILYNLIGNAIKYQDEKKQLPWIKINYKNIGDNWLVEVVDNGIGVPEEHKSKIFGMFYRATEKSTGTGLGLFIVKEAAEKLSGKVSFHSEEGKGSIFSVEFRN